MADLKLVLEGQLDTLPGALRTAVCVNPQVELQLTAKGALHLARVIERGVEPDRVVILYRDAPLPGFAVAILTFSVGLSVIGLAGDAALGLIDLARLVLP